MFHRLLRCRLSLRAGQRLLRLMPFRASAIVRVRFTTVAEATELPLRGRVPAAYALLNADDWSFSLTQEIQYRLVTNLELRSQVSVIAGRRGTDFGERRADWRTELRLRCYF